MVPPAQKPVRKRRKRGRVGRWIARILCVLFAIVGLLPVVAGALMRTEFASQWAAAEGQRLLREEAGLEAVFQPSVQPWPLTIIVDHIEIASSDGTGPAIIADRVRLRPHFFSLLQGRVSAGDIEVDQPRIRLVVRDGKVVNLDLRTRSRPDSEPTDHAPFSSVAINDARIDVAVDDLRVRGSEIDVDVSATNGPTFDVAVRTGRVRIDRTSLLEFTGYGAPEPTDAHHEDAICELDARVRFDPEGVLVRRVRLSGVADLDPESNTRPSCQLPQDDLRRVALELRLVRATIDEEGPSSVVGHVRARSPLRLANRFFPFLRMEGWAAVDVDGAWHRGQKLPDIRGSVEGKGIALGIYRLASELSAQARIESGVVRLPTARVGFADGVVRITDAEIRPLTKGIPLRAKQLAIESFRFPGLMRDLGVTDHTHVRMDIDGSLSSVEGTIDPLRIDSDLVAHVRDFEVFDAAFDDPARLHVIGVRQGTVRSKFVVNTGAVEFQNGRAEFGGSHLNIFTSLGFSNDFRLKASKGTHIELEDITPLLDIPWKGSADLTAEITGVYNDPLIEGDLSIDGFEFSTMDFGDVQSGKVRFKPMIMDLIDIRGVKGRSPYRVPSMRLDFTGPAPVMADAQIETDSFDIRDFLSVFHFDTDPRFAAIHGLASAKAQLHYEQGGPLDRCGGGWLGVRGTGKLRQLDLFEEKYDDGSFDLDYEWFDRDAEELGVRADIRSVVLRKGAGTIIGSGTIRPGGVLRANAAVSGLPLSELDALGPLGSLLDARASATAEVRGTLDRMEADVDARIGPLRLGTATLPPSRVSVHLVPVDPPVRVIGRTACGSPISGPFDPVAYAKDRPAGVFEVRGDFFGGQVVVNDLQVTQQTHKVVRGTVVARALDIGKVAQLVPAVASGEEIPKGMLSGALDIRKLELDRMHTADLSLVLTALEARSSKGSVRLREGTPPITVQRDELSVPDIQLDFVTPRGISGTFLAGGQVHRVTRDPDLDLHAQLLPTDLSSLANMVPRVERARGVVEASLAITGKVQAPRYQGQASLREGSLSLSGFPVPIDDIDVLVNVGERQIRLERASARVGGGRVTATGTLPVSGLDFGTASAVITARDLHLPIIDGVKMTVDADLTASWTARLMQETGNIPRVVGDVRLVSFEYTRPFQVEADISSLADRARRTSFELYDPSQDVVDFEVRIHAPRPLFIRNNLADMKLTLDSPVLTLSGSNQRVGLRGALRVQPGGRVRLRANEFEVRDGLIRFDDMTRIAPNIDVTAVTEYRRYSGGAEATTAAGVSAARAGGQWRIQMHAHGDADSLRLDLTSQPALSQEDIILLLTLGVTRAELDQMQASSLGETAALEALSTLTGADSVVRESIPVIDDFRFGSSYSSRSGRTEPTVTVGKRVTERVRANVTSGLSDSREVRSNLEWQLTGTSSVLGSWDNVNNVSNSSLGNLGADIRFRITFE
jgi:translocation and assembly module TamB